MLFGHLQVAVELAQELGQVEEQLHLGLVLGCPGSCQQVDRVGIVQVEPVDQMDWPMALAMGAVCSGHVQSGQRLLPTVHGE